MKKIKMNYQGKTFDFEVIYECPEYIFCECPSNPAARGFFTAGYITDNKVG